jgi:LysM repeat protein
MSGSRLAFVAWPTNGAPPEERSQLDAKTARELLGLATTPTAEPTQLPIAPTAPATAVPTPEPIPTALARPGSGFLYQAQSGDTWDGIAAIFGLPVDQLRQWNEASEAPDPVPGQLVFIPRSS